MTKPYLNWDNLRVFLAVARCQSALEAGNQLNIDHSTVTRKIRRLEVEIGSKLFDRNNQGHALTSAGGRLLEAVEKMEDTLVVIEAEVGGDNQILTGQVRVGATEGFGSFFLAPLLSGFISQHPEMSIDLLAVPRFVNLSKREADIAVSIERPETGAYVVSKLSDYKLQLYATRSYLLNHPTISTLSDLSGHRFIGYVDELSYSTELRYLSKFTSDSAVNFRSTSVIAQFHAARQGHGIVVLPCFMGNTCNDLVPILPGTAEIIRTFWLIAPTERREVARVRAVWDFLKEVTNANHDFLMGRTEVAPRSWTEIRFS